MGFCVCVCTPYARNDVTLAAVQFADWLVRCGVDVRLLATNKPESGVHPHWDHAVRRARGRMDVWRWAYNATHLCWFDPNFEIYRSSRLVAHCNSKQQVKDLFFPNWGSWTDRQSDFAQVVDQTVCLSRDLHLWVTSRKTAPAKSASWVNLVSPAELIVPKDGYLDSLDVSVLVVLDRSAEQDIGLEIFKQLQEFISQNDTVRLTIALSNSVHPNFRRRALSLSELSNRCRVVAVSYPECVLLSRQHDWVYLASTRFQTGGLLSSLFSANTPILCHDLPPVGSHISDETTGKLIACELYDDRRPVAEVHLDDIGTALHSLLNYDEVRLRFLQRNIAAILRQRQETFRDFIFEQILT